MAQEAKVHVVNKENSKEHVVLPISTDSLPPLAPNSIRLQPRLVSLTANNLSYARLGKIANWWDGFPVPSSLPAPYNDTSKYGIVPCWGYAEVVSSRTENLNQGTILWGFWPSSTLPVDLQLVPTEPAGHFIDITPSRERMWSYYHRYTIPRQPVDLTSPSLAAKTVFRPLFERPPQPKTLPDESWPHADIRATAVISLSASGKTARAFNDAILNTRKPETGPLGLLAITTDPSSINLGQRDSTTTISTQILSYAASLTEETNAFLTPLQAQKILIVDFGGRADSLPSLHEHLRTNFPSTPIGIIGVGASPSASLGEVMALRTLVPDRKQMNTSEVREVVVQAVGEKKYFDGVEEAWEGFCERGGCVADVEIGKSVDDFGKGWEKVLRGEGLAGGLAYVF
ncbi:hypothetical protein Q7P37_006279 [Cladosporium fusiforme]